MPVEPDSRENQGISPVTSPCDITADVVNFGVCRRLLLMVVETNLTVPALSFSALVAREVDRFFAYAYRIRQA